MTKEEIQAAALKLSAQDREELIEQLYQSLDDEPVDPSIEQACMEVAEARYQEYLAGKVQAIPWAEVKERLRRSRS
jgi:putative addiction module component (TIGR02574 family)